jgi:Bcr/CflA subfamily drug resistance transporter
MTMDDFCITLYHPCEIAIFKDNTMARQLKLPLFPLLLVFYEIATYLSNDMYLPALPQMMSELTLSTKQAQLTLTTWFLGQAAMPLVMGILSDRYGRRPVLLVGGVLYIASTILCALSQNVAILLLGRFLEGCMVASMMVAGYACIHELYEKNEAIKLLALMGSISILAPALGPLFGGIVLYFTDWRGIFWVITVWAIVAVFLLAKTMPETLPSDKRQPIHWGQLITSYWRVLTNLHFMLLMFVLGFIFAGWIAWIAAGSLLIIENFHYSAIAFGWIQALIFAAYIVGNHMVKYLLDWLGVNKLIYVGLLITLGGGLALLAAAYLFPSTLYPFLGAMMVYSFGSALCFSPLNRSIIETSKQPMGVRVALFTVFLTSFAALGSAMSGLFFDGTLVSLAYLISVAIIIACIMMLGTIG